MKRELITLESKYCTYLNENVNVAVTRIEMSNLPPIILHKQCEHYYNCTQNEVNCIQICCESGKEYLRD